MMGNAERRRPMAGSRLRSRVCRAQTGLIAAAVAVALAGCGLAGSGRGAVPSAGHVRTDKAVTITDPRGIINATGLEADSKAKTIKFNSGISGHMEPRK